MAEPSTTAKEIFDLTMSIAAEVNENTGAADTSDTREYKVRVLSILTVLQGELYPYSDTYQITEAGKRPVLPPIKDFNTVINMDDVICRTIMPYGLGSHLFLDENQDAASFFQQRYEELRNSLAHGIPQDSESIVDCYGVSGPYNEFSSW